MPISLRHGYYPPTVEEEVVEPQIISKTSQLRVQKQKSINTNSRFELISPLPMSRVTVAKRPPLRSNTVVVKANPNDRIVRVRRDNTSHDGARRLPVIRAPARRSSTPGANNRVQVIRKTNATGSIPNYVSTSTRQRDYEHKPVYVDKKRNRAYYLDNPPVYYRDSTPPPEDVSDKLRRVRIADPGYVVKQKKPTTEYIYDTYRTETVIEKPKPRRVVQVVRDVPHRDNDLYYIQPSSVRRQPVIRKPTPTEYIQVEEAPAPVHHIRAARPEIIYVDEPQSIPHKNEYIYVDEPQSIPHKNEYIYVDEPQSIPHKNEYIYVDEAGHELNFINEPAVSPRYVEYVYEDNTVKRHAHESEVIYLEEKKERHAPESEVIYLEGKNDRYSHESDAIYLEDNSKQRSHEPEVVYVQDGPFGSQGHYKMV